MRGLVLQGGGARGAYQMGAWKAFRELGITFDVITGTSIGSLNGALMVQDEYEKCYDIWYNLRPETLMEDDAKTYLEVINANIDLKSTKRYFDYFKNIVYRGGLEIDPLIKLIDEVVDEEKIRQSHIKFGLVTFSITDREAHQLYVDEMEKGMLKDYLLASSFLPFFKPVELHGKRFIDGGVYDNFPIKLMLREEVEEIVTIELSTYNIKPIFHNREVKIKRIIPSEDLGNRFNFSTEMARRGMKMGYLDTMRAYGKIDGNKYFLTDLYDVGYLEECLSKISDKSINKYANMIGEKSHIGRRTLYEKIIPKVAKLVGASSEDSYLEIYLKALEMLAKRNRVERFEKYSFEEFADLVISSSKINKDDIAEFENIPEIFKRSSIIKSAYVDYLVYEFVVMVHKVTKK